VVRPRSAGGQRSGAAAPAPRRYPAQALCALQHRVSCRRKCTHQRRATGLLCGPSTAAGRVEIAMMPQSNFGRRGSPIAGRGEILLHAHSRKNTRFARRPQQRNALRGRVSEEVQEPPAECRRRVVVLRNLVA